MSAVSFSLSEQYIINPVLALSAPLLPADPANPEVLEMVWQFVEAELFARGLALFCSLTAFVDAVIHLVSCFCAEDEGHLERALWYCLLTVVGSVIGLIWPVALRYFLYCPPFPPDERAPLTPDLQRLAQAVVKRTETAPYDQLSEFWNGASLNNKRRFVNCFVSDVQPTFAGVRQHLADPVYRFINKPLNNQRVKWLSQTDLNRDIYQRYHRIQIDPRAYFFHATSRQGIEGILKSERVEVRHEKAFRGAFVSTTPETGFGRYIFAFNRNIERLSPLEHGFVTGQNRYWAGFSQDIPVNVNTLAFVMIDQRNHPDQEECERLQALCKEWTSRDILVISLSDVDARLGAIQRCGMGIPKEWPGEVEDPSVSGPILNTLRQRAALAVAQLPLQAIVPAQAVAHVQAVQQQQMMAAIPVVSYARAPRQQQQQLAMAYG